MNPFKILMLSNMCPPDYDGGFELRAFQIAGELRKRGHQVDLVTSHYRPQFKGEKQDPDWVHRILHFVMVSQSTSAWRYIDRLPRRIACTSVAKQNIPVMEHFLRDRHYDLAYVFGLQRNSLAVVTPIMNRQIPILWHAGDSYLADHFYHWPKTFPGYALGLNLFAKKWYGLEKKIDLSHIAFVSEFLRDDALNKGLTPQNSYIISRGFDRELGWDVDRPRDALFFMACRVEALKGVHHAVEAASLLAQRRPELNWQLEIAGVCHSGYMDQLKERIQKLHLQDRVKFLGQIPRQEVLNKMRHATAFLSCSTYGEPFAGTIIESLATGTLLIGSRAGSILEVATPEESALIYEIGDTQQLSIHMERALADPELRRRVTLKGIKVIQERYTIDRILDLTEQTFSKIVR
jgi:glycogen synthase